MRLLPRKSGRYDGPVVFVDGWHYPADKPGQARFRLVRVDPDFDRRHAVVVGERRDHNGHFLDERVREEHDAIEDVGWWEFRRPGDGDHRARFHRREAQLEGGN